MTGKRRRRLKLGEKTERLVQWLLFNVCIALIPLVFNYAFTLLSKPAPHPTAWTAFSPRGELLIVAAAIVGEGISDLLRRSSSRTIKVVMGGLCVLVLILASLLFAAIQTAQPNQLANQDLIIEVSN